MKEQIFSLRPFPATSTLPDLKITGKIARSSNRLSISYALHGSLAEITIPVISDKPARKDTLWEETCFELFLGLKGSDQYWELNLSPAGHWNVYRFKTYRQEMQEELAFLSLPFIVRNQPDALLLDLDFGMDMIVPGEQKLEIAISAVIKLKNGKVTYWALAHPGPKADFHRRDSFIIEL